MRFKDICLFVLCALLVSCASTDVAAPAADERVLLECKIATIQQSHEGRLGFEWLLGTNTVNRYFPPTNQVTRPMVAGPIRAVGPKWIATSGVLTDPQFRTIIHAIENRDGTDVLTVPRQLVSIGEPKKLTFEEKHESLVFNSSVEVASIDDALRVAVDDTAVSYKRSKRQGGGKVVASFANSREHMKSGQWIMQSSLWRNPNQPKDLVNVVLFVSATRVDENGTPLPNQ